MLGSIPKDYAHEIIVCDDMYLPPIKEVLAQVDGQCFIKRETGGYGWCAQFKIIRKSSIGEATFTKRKEFAGDWDFNRVLIDQNPTCKYTGIFAYWYNYSRNNSESELH